MACIEDEETTSSAHLTDAEDIDTASSKSSTDSGSIIDQEPIVATVATKKNEETQQKKKPTTIMRGPEAKDPHLIGERFLEPHQYCFADALREIENGRKESCWSWFFLPTAPYVVDGVERGSPMNRQYALRGDDAAEAFLTFRKGLCRGNYILLLRAISSQLRRGATLRSLLGALDDVKAVSSFQLFERMGQKMDDPELVTACREVLSLSGVVKKKKKKRRHVADWLIKKPKAKNNVVQDD